MNTFQIGSIEINSLVTAHHNGVSTEQEELCKSDMSIDVFFNE